MTDHKLHRYSSDYLMDKQADSLPPLMEAIDDYITGIREEYRRQFISAAVSADIFTENRRETPWITR